ncbi:MAG: MFS transporter [Dehalococcoidia bacterium]
MAIDNAEERTQDEPLARPAEAASQAASPLRSLLPELTALSIPAYRMWWISSASVLLNQFMTQVTLAWLILQLTDSAAWVSFAVFAFGLPTFVLGLPAGVLADRWDRRKQLVLAQSAALINAVVLAVVVATDLITPGLALVFAMISGATVAVSQPARQSLIRLLVPKEHLMNGIVLGSLSQSLSQMTGPMLAGLLIATISITASFVALAFLLIVGIVSLLKMQVPSRDADRGPQKPFRLGDLLGGITFVWSQKPLFVVTMLYLATGIWIVGAIQALVPVLVRDYYHAGASALGFAYTVQAIFGVATSLWITKLGHVPNKGGIFALSMTFGALGLLGYGLAPSYAVSLLFFAMFGVAASFYSNMSQTLLQKHSPQEVLGRVLAIVTLSIQGFIPLGALQAGLVASAFDARIAAVYGALVGMTLALGALISFPSFRKLD